MDATQTLQRLGWEWRQDGVGAGTGPGVIIRVQIGGRVRQVFIPLSRVWLTFDQELQRVGCPSAQAVGAPFSVGGFFSFIKRASSVVRNVVPKAVQRAASKVAAVAKRYGGAVVRGAQAVAKNPVFRGAVIAASFAVPALAPAAAALEIANRASAYYARGVQAAKAIKAGYNTAANVAAVRQGLTARNQLHGVIRKAQQGDARARQVVGAMQQRLLHTTRSAPGGQQVLQHAQSAVRQLQGRPGFAQAAQAFRSFGF